MRNRRVVLTSRPVGIPAAGNFAIVEDEAREPGEGEVVVRNALLSVEPAMRGWIADAANYSQPVPLGATMRSLAAGQIIASRHPDWSVGDRVTGWFGWQEIATVAADAIVRRVEEADLPLSLSLGLLGINGVTALLALTRIGEPKPGETVVVSTAAGSVGSAAGQIAKLMGCRTIGVAGGREKVRRCLDEFGYDEALDYRSEEFEATLASACPNGVDVYFDNTAGRISDAVLRHLNVRARVIVCGTASIPDWSAWPQGPRVERHVLVKRARIQGFVVFDHTDEFQPSIDCLARWVREGRLRYREHVLEGIEACPDAIARLYRGENDGKLLVRLNTDPACQETPVG